MQPTDLGVRLDRALTFNRQVEAEQSIRRKMASYPAFATKTGGGAKRMRARYISPPNAPYWTTSGNMDKLDAAQNESLRRITGQATSIPLESLRLEAGVQSYHSRSKYLWATSYEKAIRLPANHPRKIASSSGPPKRLKRNHWRQQGEAMHDE